MSQQQTNATFVFLHGSGDSAATWQPLIQHLPALQCLALDLPGHGAAIDAPGPQHVSVSDYAQAVHTEVQRRGLSNVCVVGHSLGGAIALTMAVAFPQVVTSLMIVGSGSRLRVAPHILEVAKTEPAVAAKTLIEIGFAPGHEAMAEAYYIAQAHTAPGALYRDLSACDAFDIMAELGRITQPTLIITGEDDQLTPPKYARFLKEHLANATLALIPQAGHFVHYEQPEAVAAAIQQWII